MQTEQAVQGEKFQVRLWREGRGRPLLYLHGYDGAPDGAPFLRRLADRYEVFAPEHPGFGESSGFEHLEDIHELAFYYRSLVEELGLAAVDVVGHCLGGMFAAEFAALSPSLVRRLVLVDAFGLWRDDRPIPDLFVLGNTQLNSYLWHDLQCEAAAGVLEAQKRTPTDDETLLRTRNLAAASKFLWPIPDRRLHRRLQYVKAPTLLVWGDDDGLIDRAYAEEFREALPDARVAIIPDAGHYPMLEQPDAFHAAVTAFLDEETPGA